MRAKALLAATAGVLLSLPVAAQTVDEILAKHIEARGGKEKLAAVQSARATGKMTMGPMEVPFVMEWKAPNRVRQEFMVQGKAGVRAYDGATAWMHMPFMGKAEPEKMAAEDTADMAQEADLIEGPLVDYAKKGHQVRLVGKKEIEGTEVYELEITMKNGDVTRDYLDAESFLTIKQESKQKQGDQEMEITTSIGNYQQVDGLMLPFAINSTIKGAPAGAGGQSITIEKYEFGGAIEDSRFAFPSAAAADKPAETKPPGN
jgi:outer membrane lipoprotein-sorting protein